MNFNNYLTLEIVNISRLRRRWDELALISVHLGRTGNSLSFFFNKEGGKSVMILSHTRAKRRLQPKS